MGKRGSASPSKTTTSDIESAMRAPPPNHQSVHGVPLPWTPWLVPTFAAANAVAFAFAMYVNDCPHNSDHPTRCLFPSLGRFSFQPLTENPLFGPSTVTLDLIGALDRRRVVMDGEGWRLLTCIWLHAGVIHLVANMLSLLFIGIRLEQEFGFVRIGMLYVFSGFGGSLLSSLSLRTTISVGASGALFGMLGAMLSELITNWTIYANKFAALLTLIIIIGINLAIGVVPHVDSSAHIGGFLSGFLLGFVLLIRPQFGWISRKHIPPGYDMELLKPKHKAYQYVLWFIAFIILVTGYTGGLIKLFHASPLMY